MPRRITKQIFYGLFYLAIWGGIGAFLYFGFIRPTPSCTNGREDGNEEGIDCGGVCKKVCIPTDLRSLEITDGVKLLKPKAGVVELLAKVQNANFEFAAKRVGYTFNVYDTSGTLLDSLRGETLLYAGEIRYVTAIEQGTAISRAARAELVIDPGVLWEPANRYMKPTVSGIRDQRITSESDTITVSGRITNNDTVPLPAITVLAVFVNDFRVPIGFSETQLDMLGVEEGRTFTIAHPALPGADLAKTQLFVYALRP